MKTLYFHRTTKDVEVQSIDIETLDHCYIKALDNSGNKMYLVTCTDKFGMFTRVITIKSGKTFKFEQAVVDNHNNNVEKAVTKFLDLTADIISVQDDVVADEIDAFLKDTFDYDNTFTKQSVIDRHIRMQQAKRTEAEEE